MLIPLMLELLTPIPYVKIIFSRYTSYFFFLRMQNISGEGHVQMKKKRIIPVKVFSFYSKYLSSSVKM